MVECLRPLPDHIHVLDSQDNEALELQKALVASAELFQTLQQQQAESRERLQKAAEGHGARITPVKADGNCQFRALSVALYGNEDSHSEIRAQVVEQMMVAPAYYATFVIEPYAQYLERMRCCGEWGDHVTLQAASDALKIRVQVLTDVPESPCVEVIPRQLRSTGGLVQQPLWSLREPLCIAFQTEWHYDAAFLVSTGDMPRSSTISI